MTVERARDEWMTVASSPPLSGEELEQLQARLERAGLHVTLWPEAPEHATRELRVNSEDLDIARQIMLGSQEIYK